MMRFFMRRSRTIYFILITLTIIAGLLSRHYKPIPPFIGDILWATMVYFMMRFLFIGKLLRFSIVASLLFSYAIEFSQLYQAPWINEIRHTLFGRLVLGQGFLWSDLLCYTIGVLIGVMVDRLLQQRKP
jgi:hypothetical protein